jgi:hypothetical protein
MLRKKEAYTHITPIPAHIPRQLAIDILHAHEEIISLNPLVLTITPTKPPPDAPADEYYCTWYEITERIQYVPGAGRFGSGKISFKGCFHDLPWGIQTHMYAPLSIDLRNKWRICGNQPGEPVEAKELGIGAPTEGLYLREDIEIKCNITMVSFVKSQMKAASKILVDRLIKKAELLDSGVLKAMMENGKLKTINPADRTNTMDPNTFPPNSPPLSHYQQPHQPTAQQQYLSPGHNQYQQPQQQQAAVMELPGDHMYYDQNNSGQYPSYTPRPAHASYQSQVSNASPALSQTQTWGGGSRPSSYSSEPQKHGQPPMHAAAELPAYEQQAPPLPAKDHMS